MSFQRRDIATIQFFNILIEQILQGLSPSETKVLLLVARQTMGWTDGKGGHKAQDWMTNKYLQERCHLSHTSVSAAIESLVKKNLIEVKDQAGQTLQAPAERRRCSRLLFSLVTSRRVQEPPHAESLPDTEDGIPKTGKLERQAPRYVPQNEEVSIEEPQALRMHKSGLVKAVESSPPIRDLLAMQSSGKLLVHNQPDKSINLHPMQNIGFQKLETTKSNKYINKNINNNVVVSKKLNTHSEPKKPMQNYGNVGKGSLPPIEHLEVLCASRNAEEAPTDKSERSVTNEDVISENVLISVPTTSSNCGTMKENLKNTFVDPRNDELHDENTHHEQLETGREFASLPISLSREAKQVLSVYCQQFRQHFPDKSIPKATQSDFEKLESYFEKHKSQVLISLLSKFFTIDYDFNSRNDYSLHAFVHSVNLLLYGMKRIGHFAQIRGLEGGSGKTI